MINNTLLWGSLATLLFYATASALLPGQFVSSAVSFALLVFGAVTAQRYVPEAWDVVIHKVRGPNRDGSHLAVYGVALLALGSVYVGAYGLLWVAMGQPDGWLGTPFSAFGRFMMTAGFALMFISPDVSKRGLRLPARTWVWALVALIALAAFFFGVKVGPYLPDGQFPIAKYLSKEN